MLPLDGVRVLDLGSVLMAPYAAQWLADLGADVIKIEPPQGDSTRGTGPAQTAGMAAMFLALNRNKRSIVLDLKSPEGRQRLMELADVADILLHNNRPQKMEALGLGPQVLRARNSRLIYACFHGFGAAGPYGGRPAYDDVIQGMCGLADLRAQQSGTPGYLPTVVADKVSGMTGALAILAAIVGRNTTGDGAYVEVPMFESMVAFTAVEHLYGHTFQPSLAPAAYPRALTPERRPFATRDGYICVLPYTDRHWRRLFEACERPDLAADVRFATMGSRTQNIAALYQTLADLLETHSTADWLRTLDDLEIPCGPVSSLEDLIEDEHLAAVGFFAEMSGPDGAQQRLPGVPVLFNGQRPPVRRAPQLGEHNANLCNGWPP